MGKSKRRQQIGKATANKQGKHNSARRQHSQVLPKSTVKPQTSSNGVTQNTQFTKRPRIPFTRQDRVLLIGEGDLSFALSLVKHHKPHTVVATCYDTREQLVGKYPNVMRTVAELDPGAVAEDNASREYSIKATPAEEGEDTWEGFSPSATHSPSSSAPSPPPPPSISSPAEALAHATTNQPSDPTYPNRKPSPHHHSKSKVLYSISATLLSTPSHLKLLRPHGPFTKIVFNFPHVGGLSTDVNRQVRANQELLVKFFGAAKPLLLSSARELAVAARLARTRANNHGRLDSREATRAGTRSERWSTPPTSDDDDDDDDGGGHSDSEVRTNATKHTDTNNEQQHQHQQTTTRPQLLITLFDSPPYTLWNIRDLARHSGYNIVESFKFPWESYPGYRHARTLGDIVDKRKQQRGEGGASGSSAAAAAPAGDETLGTVDDENGGREEFDGIVEQKPANNNDTEGRGNDEAGKEKTKQQQQQQGKKKARWRGEERDARCYVLEVKDDEDNSSSNSRYDVGQRHATTATTAAATATGSNSQPLGGTSTTTGKRKRGTSTTGTKEGQRNGVSDSDSDSG